VTDGQLYKTCNEAYQEIEDGNVAGCEGEGEDKGSVIFYACAIMLLLLCKKIKTNILHFALQKDGST